MLPNARKYILAALLLFSSAIIVRAQVSAGFTADKLSGCAPLLVSFTDQSTGSNITTRSWVFNNGSSSNNNNTSPSTIFTAAGTYTVTLTVSNGTSTDVETKTAYITVYPNPSVNFSATPLTGCPPLTVNFANSTNNNAAGAATYTWYTGAGTSTLQNPTQVYNTPGTKTVTLTVKNSNGCSASLTKTNYILVYNKPSPNFTATSTIFCSSPATVNFTSTTSGGTTPYTYFWNSGNIPPSTSTNANPSFTYTGAPPINYDVKLVVTDSNGCKDSIVKADFIKMPKPIASFSAPSQACVNTGVSFTNTSTPAPTGALWFFGDAGNNTSTQMSSAFTYNTAGTYTVTLVTYAGGCTDTTSKTIVINPAPTFDFYKVPDTLCPAPQTVKFFPTTSTSVLTSYWWNLGDGLGSITTTTSPSYTYTQNGLYTVKLAAVDNKGCVDTVTKSAFVKLYDLTTRIEPPVDSGCAPLLVRFKSFVETDSGTLYPYPVSTYSWDFGDGNSSTSKNPNHTYVDTGKFRVTLKITTTKGCIAYDTTYVYVGKKPVISFTASPTIVCPREPVSFLNTTTGTVTGWVWDFGDGGRSIDRSPSHIYTIADTFNIELEAYHNGCMSRLEKVEYIIVKPSVAAFIAEPNCDTPLQVKFRNMTVGATSHTFYFGDGGTSLLDNPVHTYAANGNYNAKIVVHNSNTGCWDSVQQTVTLLSLDVDFSADDTTVCLNDTVTFTPSITGGAPTEYNWYVDGTLKQIIKPTFRYVFTDTGYHEIKLEVSDINTCEYTKVKSAYILVSQPRANFGATPLMGCVPHEVLFKDSSATTQGASIISRKWFVGPSSFTTTDDTLRYTYMNRGAYDVKIVVTDDIGCKDSFTRVDYVHPHKPIASFNNTSKICQGDTVQFFNFSINSSLSFWDFGDGDTITNPRPRHIYAQKGTFTPTLVVSDSLGCKDTLVGNPIRVQKPVASFTVSDSIAVCPPLLANFTNTSTGIINVLWDLGNGTTTSAYTPSDIYTAKGNYPVRLIVTDTLGCKDTAYQSVKVLGYAGAFTYTPLIGCKPMSVQFSSTTTASVPTVVWDFGDGSTVTNSVSSLSHTYTAAGKYLPKVIFGDGSGCQSFSDGIDTITVDEIIANFEPDAPCENSIVQFDDKSISPYSNVATWSWKFDNGQTSAKSSTTNFYGSTGSYPVTLYVSNVNGCKDSITKNITIYANPTVTAGDDTVICVKDSVMLQPTGAVTYTWSPAIYLSCINCTNPYASPPQKIFYTVVGADANGCKDTSQVVVDTKTDVESATGAGGEICEGDKILLSATGARTYKWSPAGVLDSDVIGNPEAFPTQTTKFMVIAYEGSCKPDTNFVDVIVRPKPDPIVTGEQTIVAGTSADLSVTGDDINRVIWSPSESLSCDNCPSTIATPLKTTTYILTAYSRFNCVDSESVTVKVLCDKSQVFIPNTFTPNGDGQNDVFYPRGTGIETINSFRIYNRWGEVVFKRQSFATNDKASAWDGTYNGKILPPDVYVYVIEATCDEGEVLQWKGDVTIIR